MLDRNVGETEVDQTDADRTDANPGTNYKDIYWQDGRRIVELKTLAEQLNACDGCDTPLNLLNGLRLSGLPLSHQHSYPTFFPMAYFSFF
jgi:hypothetical protein